ncbi:cell division protein ZapE [Angustibacter sp. McL0619]|uniref:cell division protein ZapE n=1 Tax=Angustibacter sp. McL0619 TaxID=3415676 RepID=UPI003CE9B7B5
MPGRLADRDPRPDPQRLLDDLVPPPHFAGVSFDGYRPDPAEPSQLAALERLRAFAGELTASAQPSGRRLLRRPPRRPDGLPGIYLDGGFGVGKTHLLASLWHTAPAPKTFGTFVELTHLVGALGFGQAVERLSTRRLVCIDEFELDDPGDTVLMSTLLARLVEAGVRVAATSNTLPDALGEGRFAAEDFLREIQALSARFEVLRINGEDYRHRGLAQAPGPVTDEQARAWAQGAPGRTCDEFDTLCAHLATVHPSRYGALVDGVRGVALTGLHQVSDQNVALRLVVLADRFYDRDVPVVVSGGRLADLFTPDMLRGGYRKKYLRTLSRLTALAREAGTALG